MFFFYKNYISCSSSKNTADIDCFAIFAPIKDGCQVLQSNQTSQKWKCIQNKEAPTNGIFVEKNSYPYKNLSSRLISTKTVYCLFVCLF